MSEHGPASAAPAAAIALFDDALAAARRGDQDAWRAGIDAAARAGHAVALRAAVAAALHASGPDAARGFLDGLNGPDSLRMQALWLRAELERFHGQRDERNGSSADDRWSRPLARAALAGHGAAVRAVQLYRDWGFARTAVVPACVPACVPELRAVDAMEPPAAALPGADDPDVRTLAAWLHGADHDWIPDAPERLAETQGVRVERIRGFAPLALTRAIRTLLGPRLQPSLVVDPRTGARIRLPLRTCTQAQWLPELRGWIGKLLDERLARSGGYIVACGEVANLLRYQPGEAYLPHHDCLPLSRTGIAPDGRDEGGQRLLTQLLGIGEAAFEGGETEFTELDLRIRVGAGDLVSFSNADAEGQPLAASRHAGCALRSGEKWLLSRWVRARPTPYGRELPTTF